jgi:hypothetical protein
LEVVIKKEADKDDIWLWLKTFSKKLTLTL